MNNYAVLGLGLMGKAICFDILTFDTESYVIGYEINEKRRNQVQNDLSQFGNRILCREFTLEMKTDHKLDPLIKELRKNEIKVVFGAIDYSYNEYLTKICLEASCSFLDLGGNPDIVKSQFSYHTLAISAGVTIIPDCGLAPGMANIVAAQLIDSFDTVDECHIRVGGLPQDPETILKYQQVFSIRGLTNEYLEPAIIIREGKIQQIPSLTEVETLEFPSPWLKLEAFQTSGGSSNLPEIYEGKIKELTYKTIRYPGHCQFFQFLKEFGFMSSEENILYDGTKINPREVTEYQLQKYLPKNQPDAVLVRIWVTGKIQNKKYRKIAELIDKEKAGFTSMARTTAFPTAIIGQMIMRNLITKKGVLAGEQIVPKTEFITELIKREISFYFSIIEM